ncbi:MAG: hypothetical protein ACXAB7_20850 [Candidatus Kariarchaeaceae archaeon]
MLTVDTSLDLPAHSPASIKEKTKQIYMNLCKSSDTIDTGNFTDIDASDLHYLWKQYDKKFFDGNLLDLVEAQGSINLSLSNKMTRAGGKTICTRNSKTGGHRKYEIRISRFLLLQSFSDVKRSILVNGMQCLDRIEALQRIFEHELVHLYEMLKWRQSSCAKQRFRTLATHLFAHTDTTHQLITSAERAKKKFDIRIGDIVFFNYKRRVLSGLVNRITKRATILVEDAKGRRYSNGHHYTKYYVPISRLRK